MSFEQFDIDLSLKPIRPKITLHKPNLTRTQIANITDLYDVSYNEKASNVDELIFSIPIDVERQHQLIENKDVSKIKNRYLLKLTLGNKSKWFQIRKPKSQMTNDEDNKVFEAFSLEIELSDKILRSYSVVSKNCTQVLTEILNAETIWNIDFVDASYDLMYRSFDITSKTILEFILTDIQETFGAIAIFNTENRTVSIYNPDNLGINRGLKFSHNRYLQSLGLEYDDDNHCTRIIVTGMDDISIQDQSITGENFLQDLSYYMYPFEKDELGNVIKSSDYMSDELCINLINYNSLLEEKDGEFNTLLSQKEDLEIQLTTKENELFTLNTELTIIRDNIDINQANNIDASQLLIDEQNKLNEINIKQGEIDTINSNMSNINISITNLKNEVSLSNNFTPEQIIEMNPFIIQKEINNQYISDSKELLKFAEKEFEKLKIPPIKIDIDIINFLSCVTEQRNWGKLNLFDIITVEVERLRVNVQAKILEINRDFESDTIKLTISNIIDIQSDKDKFIKNLNKSLNTSTTVDMSKYKWNGIDNVQSDVDNILTQKWETSLREIVSGVEDSVEVNRRGITSFNPSDPNKALRITHGIIGITSDNFNSLGLVMDGSGVYGERIIGQIIAGENLTITTGNGDFLVNSSGVKISGLALEITDGGIPESQLSADFINRINTDIQNVNDLVNDLQEDILYYLSDSTLTAIEANSLKNLLNQVMSESQDLISVSTTLDITTEKDNYNIALNDLNTYLTTYFLNQLNYPIDITTIQRDNIITKFNTVQSTKSILINKIMSVRELNSNNYASFYTDTAINDFVSTTYNTDISNLQSQIDGNITTWFYNYEPTLINIPASDWITVQDKNIHLGDLFYNTVTGYAYRFALNGTYQWIKITDTDITKALSDASTAQDTADSKRRVFVSQPIPPYDIGDLWRTEGETDLKICTSPKTISQLYSSTDWVYATDVQTWVNTQISEIDASIATLQLNIDQFSSDLVLSLPEANTLKLSLDSVIAESTDIINIATSLGITTEKNNYSTALTTLTNYLNTNWLGKTYPLTITLIQRTNVTTCFQEVESKKSILINKITAIREQNANLYSDNNLTNFVDNVYATDQSSIQSQIDGKIESYFTSTDPNIWLEADRIKHNGDMWYNTSTKLLKRYDSSTNTWQLIEDQKAIDAYTNASTAQDTADGKRRVFVSQPIPPYDIGDLWTQGTNGDLMRCAVTKSSGSYLATDWIIATKYTDDTIANQAQQDAIDAQNSADIANALLTDIANDNKLTASEKQLTKKEWDIIVSEKTIIDAQATIYGIITEKTNYDNAYNLLNTYITPLLSDLTTTVDIIGTTFRTKFKDYYDNRTTLLKAVAEKAKLLADTAQSTANNAWNKFSGDGNTLPAGNVEFNFAGSTTQGGNALNTDNVGNQTATTVQTSVSNFNNRNDRISTIPANPIVSNDGTAIYYQPNDDGSVNIVFNWNFTNGTGANDIDGFYVYAYSSTSSNAYTIGTSTSLEHIYFSNFGHRSITLYGVPANKYYTFGIASYRIVDSDISSNGILKSSIIQTTLTSQNPFRPSANIAFNGNLTGINSQVNGVPASTISTVSTNFNNRNDRLSDIPASPTSLSLNKISNTDGSADISFTWNFTGSDNTYNIDGFFVYIYTSRTNAVYNFGTTPTSEKVFSVDSSNKSFILYGVAPDIYYTFGVKAYRVVDPDVWDIIPIANKSGGYTIIGNIATATPNPYQPSTTSNFTGNINGTSSSTISGSALNFNNRNDRISTTPANPIIVADGTAIDHTINTDSSANISFEWQYTGSGDSYDIDGFILYCYQSSNNSVYTYGTDIVNEQVFYVTPEKRAFILYGTPVNKYYTFGIQAYRIVDQDINSSGVLKSSIIKPSIVAENPYQPSSTVAFNGDVTGTISGTSATTLVNTANTALANANNAQASAITANNLLSDISSDSKLTATEKQQTKKEWDIIVSEKPIIESEANNYGIVTELTNYNSSYSALNTYITPLLTDLTTTSDIVGTTFRNNFKVYYDNRTTLLTAISNKAKLLADNAQATANSSVQQGTLYNGVKMDSVDGIVVTRTDNKSRSILNATSGLKIQVGDGTGNVWTDKLYADLNGSLVAEDLTAKKLIITNGSGDAIINANTGVIDFSKFTTKLGELLVDNVPIADLISSMNSNNANSLNGSVVQNGSISAIKIKTQELIVGDNITMGANATISWNNVTSQPNIPQDAADVGALPVDSPKLTKITSTGLYTGNIEATNVILGNGMSGGSVNFNAGGSYASFQMTTDWLSTKNLTLGYASAPGATLSTLNEFIVLGTIRANALWIDTLNGEDISGGIVAKLG